MPHIFGSKYTSLRSASRPCPFWVLAVVPTLAFSQSTTRIQTPVDLSSYVYTGNRNVTAAPASRRFSKALAQKGQVQVIVRLQDPPLVVALGPNAKQNGIKMTADQQRAYLANLTQKQNALMTRIQAQGGRELGRVAKGHNALIVEIGANQLSALSGLNGVTSVRPLINFQIAQASGAPGQPDLSTTLPYVGATAVQNSGVTGRGVKVAMLDSGIDYTHYNLGGSGNVADYTIAAAAAASAPPPNLFPTAKVVGGYDFVGDTWPNGDGLLHPDPNPIDLNGHGSHTSDIVGGRSLDGLHKGVAPDSKLYAVKVCSSVSTACSGLAILEGLEFALDPDNTGTLNSPVDVISMSIGGSFGQREQDASEMFTNIVQFGIVAVLSAGNDGDIPYVVGFPAATPEVVAAAATTAVNGFDIPLMLNSPTPVAGTYPNTATLDFAPIGAPVTANVAYVGQGCPAGSISAGSPADPYLANPSGKIALVDRGACSVSLKIDRAASAGAVAVLIGLVAPGDAVAFSNAGGSNFVPTLVITQSVSAVIKNALAGSPVNATISPNNAIPLSGNIASYSSRGPNYSYNMLKPDMSAPGTVDAAQPGTGNGQTTESGTSFACPMMAGSAALLLSKNPSLTPLDIKALLMETSEPEVFQNVATSPGVLAPMSRMGSGELRVDRAVAASTAAWDASDPLSVSLSFGTYRLNLNQTFKKKVVIRNYSNAPRSYTISNVYRDAPNTTGVTLTTPATVSVPANGSANFNLTLQVNAAALPVWDFFGGQNTATGSLLQTVEYAGYLTFTSGSEHIHLPWHILPHKAANVAPAFTSVALNGQPFPLNLSNINTSAGGQVDVFSLTGTNMQYPPSFLPAPGDDFAVINLRAAGVRLVCLALSGSSCTSYGVQFAVNTFGQRSHPSVPAEFDIDIYLNGYTASPDLIIFNEDIGLATTGTTFSGQDGVFVVDVAANTATLVSYAGVDLDSANAIFTLPLSALSTAAGLQVTPSTPFIFTLLAVDNYYTGDVTGVIGPMQYELDSPKYYASAISFVLPANTGGALGVFPNNASNPFFGGPYDGNSPSQSGLLLIYKDAKTPEADIVTVTP
jgi:subtilisin family serine protease